MDRADHADHRQRLIAAPRKAMTPTAQTSGVRRDEMPTKRHDAGRPIKKSADNRALFVFLASRL